MDDNVIDICVPEYIYNNNEMLNTLMNFLNISDGDSQIYYREKLLNMLSDTQLLEFYYTNRVWLTTMQKVHMLVNEKQRRLNILLTHIYDSGIMDSSSKDLFLDGFNFDNYTKTYNKQSKVALRYSENDVCCLVMPQSYTKYVLTMDYKVPSPIMSNTYSYIYNSYIRYMLSREYHVSDLPKVNLGKWRLINAFYHKCSI